MKIFLKSVSSSSQGCTAAVVLIAALMALPAAAQADSDDEITVEIELGDDSGEQTLPPQEDSLEQLPPIERMPEVLQRVDALYPPELVRQGVEGTVLLEVLISDSGRVDSVSVVQGAHPQLDSSAVAALRQFRFSPAIAGGEAVPVLIQYEYPFTLREVVEKISQYKNFSGLLLERGTRAPLADAMVVVEFLDTLADTSLGMPFTAWLRHIGSFEGQYLEENRLVTLTDSTGHFSFSSLPTGPIAVNTPVAGYELLGEQEQIVSGEQLEVKYYLQRLTYSDYEIVVYGQDEKKEVSRRQLTLAEVKKIPGLGGDAVKVVQALPGVARPTFGGSEVIVRGSSTGDSKYLLDGVEIPLLFHFGGLKSTYNSDALKAVDFYPGGWGTRYGGAIGGVVELAGRPAKTDRWHANYDVNFMDGTLFAEGPINEKVSVLATARRSFIGEIISWAAEQQTDQLLITTAPFYWDYIVRTDVALSKTNNVFVTLFGMLDGAELIVSEGGGGSEDVSKASNSAKTELLFHLGLVGWDAQFGQKFSNSLRYSFSKKREFSSEFGNNRFEINYFAHQFRDQLSWEYSPKLKLNFGANILLAPVDFDYKFVDYDGSVQTGGDSGWIFGDYAPYFNLEWKPSERWLIVPGIRYDYFQELDYEGAALPPFWNYESFDNTTALSGEPSARLSARYKLTPSHTLKGSLGNYSQTPQPMGEVLHKTLGNPQMPASRAAQYVLGHEWQLTDLVHSDVQLYFNRQWDLPRSPSLAEIGPGMKLKVPGGKKRMYGLEMMLRHDQGERFFGWISYSLSRGERYKIDEKDWVRLGKDQTHNLIAVGSMRLPRGWEAGLKFQFTTGDPQTPIIGQEYVENERYYRLFYGATNSDRMPPTAQLDLRFDRKIVLKKYIISAYVDFFNIGYFLYKSPQAYFEDSNYPFDPDKGTVNSRPIYQYSIPSFGMKVEF